MLLNYLKIILRNLRRQKGYAFINIAGLSLGVACCIIIFLYVQHELSYDKFHPDADRIYRVAVERNAPNDVTVSAQTPPPLAAALVNDLPSVEKATRIWRDRSGRTTLRYDSNQFYEERVFFADSNFFDIFPMQFIDGDPQTALSEPFAIVLTASMASKYFGTDNPIGKTITLREPSDRDLFQYHVTGVIQNPPANMHFKADFLASYMSQRWSRSQNWHGFAPYTYITIQPGATPKEVAANLPAMLDRYATPQTAEAFGLSEDSFEEADHSYRYFLQPVTDIHLGSHLSDEIEANGNATAVYLFGIIALFILLNACVNFINLATARSTKRAREVGMRKALGSSRWQIVRQFLVESLAYSSIAVVLAVITINFTLPVFYSLTGKELALPPFNEIWLWLSLIGLTVTVGLLAGSYPALFLSAFQPTSVLVGSPRLSNSRSILRNGLVMFQFAISIALMVGAIVVYSQLTFMIEKDLGFDKSRTLVIEGAEVLHPRGETFKDILRQQPGILSVSNAERTPGSPMETELFRLIDVANADLTPLQYTYTGFDFVETLGLTVIDGRSLSRDYASDSTAVLLNESAVRALNILDPVGKKLEWPDEGIYTIVGVVEDFHFQSLHTSIQPLALLGPDPRNQNRPNLLMTVRIDGRDLPTTLSLIQKTWEAFAPQNPYAYRFLDADFRRLHQADRLTSRLFGAFAGLAILIACMGLFGLAAYTAEQRTKEIGVRKTLGATAIQIITLLSKDFFKLVLLAFIIAAPLAYLAMNKWLSDFAYHIDVSWSLFVLVAIIVTTVTIITVSFQAIRASLANPVDALRYE